MDQVSPPMRFALLAVLAFAGLWLVALRPKPAEPAPAPQAPVSAPAKGLTGAPAKAEKAVAKANGKTARRAAATKAPTAAKPSVAKADPAPAPAAAKPKKAVATAGATAPAASPRSGTAAQRNENAKVKRVLADIEAKKVVVLLFWDKRNADDREVYRSVESADRHDGKVSVRAAPIQQLDSYDAVTQGVPVVGSPTVMVIDRQKRATVITGLTVKTEIDAVVRRALGRK